MYKCCFSLYQPPDANESDSDDDIYQEIVKLVMDMNSLFYVLNLEWIKVDKQCIKRHIKFILLQALFNISLSIRILCNVLLESANDLLNYYVYNSNECYGDKFSVCNVHRLIHIADDVEYFTSSKSGVSFENYLQQLKRYVRSRHNSVPQI